MRRLAIASALSLLGLGLPGPAAAASSAVPQFDHIFVIVMENHSYTDIIGSPAAPYLNQLASQNAVAGNYFAVTHPSLPNYLSLTGGDTFGINTDCTTCFVSAPNLADRIEASGRSWKAYMEGMPGACFLGDSYPYAQKHDPFIYYDDIRNSSSRCSRIVPYSQLSADLASASSTPSFVWITPDMCHDMHDCAVSDGDAWLQQNVPAILGSPAFRAQNSLLAITWDEDDFSGSNWVPTILVGPSARPGFQSATWYNHFYLLKTVEAAWGLPPLTGNDSAATPMTDLLSTACSRATLSSNPGSPQPAGTTITFSAGATGCSAAFRFWLQSPGSSSWTIVQDYSPTATWTWSTSGLPNGSYQIAVWARAQASSADWEAYTSLYFTLGYPPCGSASLSPLPTSPQLPGTGVAFSAQAAGCQPSFRFWLQSPGSSAWTIVQDYSSNPTWTWSTAGLPTGSYRVAVWARAQGSSAGWESYASLYFTLARPACTSASLSASPASPQHPGTAVTFSAQAAGCSAAFRFWLQRPGSTTWTLVQDYSSSSSWTWSTTALATGTYRVAVWARAQGSGADWQAYNSLYFTLG